MTDIRTRAFIGIVGLAVAGFISIGCGGSSESTGGAGSTGSAGTTGGGGSTGSGGTGTGGATGCPAAATALITDFGAGTSAVGTPYSGAQTGLTGPTVSTAAGSLDITVATGAPTMMYPYAYVGLPFNACTSASAYTGVKFNISGTLNTGCTIQFSVVDKAHSTMANNGSCPMADNCYAAAKVFTLPATAQDVTVLFADHTGGGVGGATPPPPPVNPAEILNIQWQFNVATDGCTGSVKIDNVTFM
jgi:hypothetical protein